jgi:hypothetical protein
MPHSAQSPPTPGDDSPPRRPPSTWLKLLAVWVVGLGVWGLYFWIVIVLLIRLSS